MHEKEITAKRSRKRRNIKLSLIEQMPVGNKSDRVMVVNLSLRFLLVIITQPGSCFWCQKLTEKIPIG